MSVRSAREFWPNFEVEPKSVHKAALFTYFQWPLACPCRSCALHKIRCSDTSPQRCLRRTVPTACRTLHVTHGKTILTPTPKLAAGRVPPVVSHVSVCNLPFNPQAHDHFRAEIELVKGERDLPSVLRCTKARSPSAALSSMSTDCSRRGSEDPTTHQVTALLGVCHLALEGNAEQRRHPIPRNAEARFIASPGYKLSPRALDMHWVRDGPYEPPTSARSSFQSHAVGWAVEERADLLSGISRMLSDGGTTWWG